MAYPQNPCLLHETFSKCKSQSHSNTHSGSDLRWGPTRPYSLPDSLQPSGRSDRRVLDASPSWAWQPGAYHPRFLGKLMDFNPTTTASRAAIPTARTQANSAPQSRLDQLRRDAGQQKHCQNADLIGPSASSKCPPADSLYTVIVRGQENSSLNSPIHPEENQKNPKISPWLLLP